MGLHTAPAIPESSGGARNFQLGGGYSPNTWRARRARAYTGIWGQSPHSWVRGQSPLWAESSLALHGRSSDEANLHHFRNFAKSQNHIIFLELVLHTHGTIIPVGVPQHLFPSPPEPRNIILNASKCVWGRGSAADPVRGAYSAPLNPLAGLGVRGEEGKGRGKEREGREGRGGEGEGGKEGEGKVNPSPSPTSSNNSGYGLVPNANVYSGSNVNHGCKF